MESVGLLLAGKSEPSLLILDVNFRYCCGSVFTGGGGRKSCGVIHLYNRSMPSNQAEGRTNAFWVLRHNRRQWTALLGKKNYIANIRKKREKYGLKTINMNDDHEKRILWSRNMGSCSASLLVTPQYTSTVYFSKETTLTYLTAGSCDSGLMTIVTSRPKSLTNWNWISSFKNMVARTPLITQMIPNSSLSPPDPDPRDIVFLVAKEILPMRVGSQYWRKMRWQPGKNAKS